MKRSKHHLKPKSRGGQKIQSNLLIMDITKHNHWHVLFGNLTLDEVIELLQRVKRAKQAQYLRERLAYAPD